MGRYNRHMHVLEMVLRTLLGVPFFLYIPGFLIDQRWLGNTHTVGGIERITARILVSMLLIASFALILAEVGWFNYWSLLVASVALCSGSMMLRRSSVTDHRPAHGLGRFDVVLTAIALVFGLV